jgi:magnesium transporter
MSYLGKSYHPPGTAPGTLDDRQRGEIEIRLVDYDVTDYVERTLEHAEDCKAYLDRVSRTWIQVNGRPDADTLRSLGRLFDLHELAMEDVLNTGQRPKMDVYDDQLFLVLAMPRHEDNSVVHEQVSIFAGPDYLICFSTTAEDPFEPLRKRMRPPSSSRLRSQGIDYLLYAIVDFVIDAAFPVLEEFGAEIEELEELLLASPEREALTRIHHVRRELLLLRRMLWPQRELVSRLQRDEIELISDNTLPFLRDCYDHCVQIIDLLESFREMSASLLEVYLSSISNRTNEVMRVLTIISTIFIPLTFIVGVYGMNFDTTHSPWGMPELGWYYGYPMVWGVMIVIVAGLMWFFRRKQWL